MKRKARWILLMLLAGLLLVGCGGTLRVQVMSRDPISTPTRSTRSASHLILPSAVTAPPSSLLPVARAMSEELTHASDAAPGPTVAAPAGRTSISAPIPPSSPVSTVIQTVPGATLPPTPARMPKAMAAGVIITTPTPAPPRVSLLAASATPTEMLSPTPGATVTGTATPTASATATRAPTDTPDTATFTPVSEPSATRTPVVIPMPSATATSTPTRTATLTPTATLTASVTPTEPPLRVIRGPDLRVARAWHTATRLADGRILLGGGNQDGGWGLADVEIFDPLAGQTSPLAPLHTALYAHTATLLPDGRVLVVGGYGGGWLNDAEVYDPSTDVWTAVPPRHSHGGNHTATLMKDGRVLVVGGGIGSCQATERVEIFDPSTNSWTAAKSLPFSRNVHTAVLLEDGRVLVIGGWSTWKGCGSFPPDGDALLYDPQADTWTATGPMITPRQFAAPVRLPDGRVLVVGGLTYEDPAPKIWASTEIYDPASNTWTAAANLAQARYTHALALLPDGQVLAVGGARDADYLWNANSFVREIERYDPVANAWRTVGALPQPRAAAAAALLPDGRLWLTGGRTATASLSDTWLIGARVESPIINVPREGDTVAMTISVSGPSSKDILASGSNFYVLVKPQGLDYWLQPPPQMTDAGWQAEGVGVGQPGDRGMAFRICAILTVQTLTSGWHAPDPPPGPLTCINVTRN